jgi:hypothetical protein
MHIYLTADAAIRRYGREAPDALVELIKAAVRLGDDDLVLDFDRILRQVERRIAEMPEQGGFMLRH